MTEPKIEWAGRCPAAPGTTGYGHISDGDLAELMAAAARLAEVEAERDEAKAEAAAALESLTALAPSSLGAQLARAEAELEAARPVVEAAVAWRDDLVASKALAAAVDLYRSATTRNLDSAVPDPSLATETLEHLHGPGGYRSSACVHAVEPGREYLHRVCQTDATRYDGSKKVAAQCKYGYGEDGECCSCPCHQLESRAAAAGVTVQELIRHLLAAPTSPLEPVPSTPRVLGYVVATKGADGFWHDDWDGKVHGDLATGRAALAECRDFGCESTLAELREVEETNDGD